MKIADRITPMKTQTALPPQSRHPQTPARKRCKFRPATALTVLAAFLIQFAAPAARAATYYWDTDGTVAGFGNTAGTWGTDAFWSTNATGGVNTTFVTATITSDAVNFGTATLALGATAANVGVSGIVDVNQITIGLAQPDTAPIVLSGGTIALGGTAPAITANNTNDTINSTITLNAAATINAPNAAAGGGVITTLTLGGAIGGANNLTFNGRQANNAYGTILLNAQSTYTGTTLITCSALNVNCFVKLGTANALPTTTVLTLDGGNGTGTAPGRTVTFNLNGNNQTLAGLASSPNRSLRTEIVTSSSAATLTVTNTADYVFGFGGTNGTITGSVALTKQGSATMTLGGNNTYSGATTISGGTLSVGAGGTGGSINNSAAITNNAVLVFNRSDAVVYANPISGTGSLTKLGAGTLTLSGANSYSGGTTNGGGVIVANSATALGTGPVTFPPGGGVRLAVATGLDVTNAIIINGGGTSGRGVMENTGTGTATNSGPISISGSLVGGGHFAGNGSGILHVKGFITSSVGVGQRTGTVMFSGGGTGYTNFTITGTAMVGAADGIATTATVDIGASGNAVLDLNGFNQSLVGITRSTANSATITNSTTTPATLTLTGTSSYAGAIKDDGVGTISLTVNGGNVTLSGALSYSGATLVSVGKLVVPSTQTGTSVATVSANATLGVTASGVSQWLPASLSLANPCTLEFNSVQNPGTTTAPLQPTATVGTVTNVTINVNSFGVTPAINNSYPLLGNQDGTTNGYTLGTQPPGVNGRLAVSGNTLVYVVDTAPDVWTGADLTNPTWWDVTNTVNWTGNALNNTPAGSYANGDTVLFDDTASTNLVSIQTNVAPGNMFFANSTKNYTVSGAFGIGGSGTLTKTGSGTLTLASSNSYSGGTTISAGTLSLSTAAATLGDTTAATTVASGAALKLQANITLSEALTLSGTGVGAADSTYGSLVFNVNSGAFTLAGPITLSGGAAINTYLAGNANVQIAQGIGGTGDLTLRASAAANGGALYRLQGASTYSGKTTFSTQNANSTGITVQNEINNSLPTTTVLTLAAAANQNAIYRLNGFNQNVAGMQISGTGTLNAIVGGNATLSTLTVSNSADYIFAGKLGHTGANDNNLALVKQGLGKLTLRGANSFTGNTTVNAGTLAIAVASLATNSTVTVAGGGAKLQLDFATTNRVGALVLNGNSQAAGVYSSNNSPAFITGPGSLELVSTGPSGPATLTNSVSGGVLSLSWPAGQGWRLQMQTNSLAVGLYTNWVEAANSSVSSTNITIDSTKPTVFYRLVYP